MTSRSTQGINISEYKSAFDAKPCLVGLPNLHYNIINSSERFLQRSAIRLYLSKPLFDTPKMGRITAYAVLAIVMDYSISIQQKFCRSDSQL